MHQNALFLDLLAKRFKDLLIGRTLIDCFSISKEEVFFVFENLCIKSTFFNGSLFLEFPPEEHLPLRNRQAVFKDLVGKKVKAIEAHHLNRSFALVFNNVELVFKCYGRNSNIILLKNDHKDEDAEIFRTNINSDKHLKIEDFDYPVKSLAEVEVESLDQLFAEYRFISKPLQEFLSKLEGTIESRLKELESNISKSSFILYQKEDRKYHLKYSFLNEDIPQEESIEFTDIIEALDQYSRRHLQTEQFSHHKNQILSGLRKELKKKNKRLESLKKELIRLNNKIPDHQIADVIMANLFNIPEGATEVTLFNFYDNKEITIKLNKDLSAQKNAEKWYRKSKNGGKEKDLINAQIEQSKFDLIQLENELIEVENSVKISDLKKWKKKKLKKEEDVKEPFRTFTFKTFDIWVGKNSKNNDELLKKGHKDDIWLHARGVAGSHVLIRNPKNENIPIPVLEFAASLAAYYSKSRNESLAEVIHTQRKYVRKFKGAAAGQVKVDQEKVLLVEPYQRN